jgi:flagella basal body P-ring formation protein FlgA
VCVAVLVFASAATAARSDDAVHDLEAIRRTAERYAVDAVRDLGPDVRVIARPLDPRLRLPACAGIEAFLPTGTRLWGRSGVGVRCPSAGGWSVVVNVQVQVPGRAAYAARPLPRGTALTEADILLREVDLATLPADAVVDVAAALGRQPRTAIAAGVALRADMLKGPDLVTAGQTVSVTFAGDGFRIGAEGKALGHGAEGESVQVRTASGRVISARVVGRGAVEVK